MKEYDVIIIGGGATGLGTARDCALRGLRVLLLERLDLTNGATGRNHGLLHSGARYAVTDRESAAECIRENMIIRHIAPGCVEPVGGLFVTLPEDGLDYQDVFVRSCLDAGIDAQVLDPDEARSLEPAVNPGLIGAVKVPDASVDPFRLACANARDATLHGAVIRTYCEVLGFLMSGGKVEGVRFRDLRSGTVGEASAPVTVNAAGIWSGRIASMAGCEVRMVPSKGALLVLGRRLCRMTVNRCRKPSNADILVPGGPVSVLGTTSSRVDERECDDIRVTSVEVDLLVREGSLLVPAVGNTRVLRAYAGVRPLVGDGSDSTGRSTSRGIALVDHEISDGLGGLITVAGGKLTTYRLMGEMATDLVCARIGVDRACRTAVSPLPQDDVPVSEKRDPQQEKSSSGKHPSKDSAPDFRMRSEVLCECEHVTRAEIAYAVRNLDVHNLIDLRRRTRVGMGTCQGTFCIGKVADALAAELGCPQKAEEFVRQYIAERWKGIAPVCWGDSLREAEFMRKKYGK